MKRHPLRVVAMIGFALVLAASCTVGDEPEPDESTQDEAYCGPYPHFAWDGYGCLPSCGAAGGTSCSPSACAGREQFDSWDCDVCCAPAPDECQASDTRCEGTVLFSCDTVADPNRLYVTDCATQNYPGYEGAHSCTEYYEGYADCSQ